MQNRTVETGVIVQGRGPVKREATGSVGFLQDMRLWESALRHWKKEKKTHRYKNSGIILLETRADGPWSFPTERNDITLVLRRVSVAVSYAASAKVKMETKQPTQRPEIRQNKSTSVVIIVNQGSNV